MAASTQQSDDGAFAGINVTPLVDITLVLLIIFMVTAKLIVSQTLPMDLPRAANAGEQQVVFSVAVSPTGDVTVDSQPVTNDQALLDAAKEAHKGHPDLRAVIQADSQTTHGKVVRVMDLLKQGGIAKIAFGVTPTPPEPGAVPSAK